MKRMFTLCLALATAVALAVPASAAKGGKPGPPDESPTIQPCPTVNTLPASGQVGFECEWTPVNDGSTRGTVTVATTNADEGGEMTRLVIFVRDSSPGDICVLEQLDKPIPLEVVASFDLTRNGDTYWDRPTDWCEGLEGVPDRDDLNGEPLHLRVNVRGKRGTTVQISLSPGQADTG